MNRLIKILISLYRKNTFPGFLNAVGKALFSIQKVSIFVREFDQPAPEKVHCDYFDQVEFGDLDDLRKTREKIENKLWEFFCHDYDNVRDFVWYKDEQGRIAHIEWIYYQGDPNRSTKLGPREAELKYGITIPEYRGKRLIWAAMSKIEDHLIANGYLRMYASILSDNASSIKGTTRAGFKFITEIRSIKLFGIQVSKPLDTATIFSER